MSELLWRQVDIMREFLGTRLLCVIGALSCKSGGGLAGVGGGGVTVIIGVVFVVFSSSLLEFLEVVFSRSSSMSLS